jgi:hypothetical protein
VSRARVLAGDGAAHTAEMLFRLARHQQRVVCRVRSLSASGNGLVPFARVRVFLERGFAEDRQHLALTVLRMTKPAVRGLLASTAGLRV